MSIRTKISLVFLISFVILSVLLLVLSESLLLRSFEELEAQAMQDNLTRVANALSDRAALMSATVGDWSYWDDTYAFAEGEYDGYPDDNLYDEAISNLGVNYVILTDMEGDILFAKAFDLINAEEIPVSEEMLAYAQGLPDQDAFSGGDLEADVRGLIQVSDGLMVVATRAITRNGPEGPPAGTFTFGLLIDEAEVASLSESLRLDTQIYPLADRRLPDAAATAAEGLAIDDPYAVQTISTEQVAGYALLADTSGEPAAVVRIEMPRDIYQQGLTVVNRLLLILAVSGVGVALAVLLIADRTVIRRVTALSREVGQIEASELLTHRVTMTSNDEVTGLSQSINRLLDRLSEYRVQLIGKNQELEQAYQQAQEATRLKSEFLATMSHEFRTPLNAIMGYTSLMDVGLTGELNERQKDYIERMTANSMRLLELINQVLDLAKIEAGQMVLARKPVSPLELVEGVHNQLKALADTKQLELVKEIDPALVPLIEGDPIRLEQILVNLVGNAIKFTDEGKVIIRAARVEPDQWQIQVSDTGIGIAPEALDYVFDEFRQVDGSSTREYGGSGLGLAIVRKLALLMGGKVRVESELAKGSTFTVILPLKAAEHAAGEVTS